VCEIHTLLVEILLCVWKTYSARRNQFCVCFSHICACLNLTASRNNTLPLLITLERVEMTLVGVKITLYACGNIILHVEINLVRV
jgi:hypothetical protein